MSGPNNNGVAGTAANTIRAETGTIDAYNLPHDNYGPQLNFTVWFLTALSALFLALRVYCKFFRHRGLWWDDYVLILAWIMLIVSCSFMSVCVSLGFGKHIWDIDFRDIGPFLFFSSFAGFFSILAAAWSKTSFAITLLRISDGWIKKFVWFAIISVNITLGLSGIFQWAQCMPVQKLWNREIEGTCWPETVQKFNISTSAYSGVIDICLALLPWKIIWTLTMNKKEKIGVVAAMSMGVFAGITSILKTLTLSGITNPDVISTINIFIFAIAETAITIMAASIPILRALLRDNIRPPPAEFYHYDENRWAGSLPSEGRASTTVSSRPRSSYGEGLDERSVPQQQRRSRLSLGLGMRFSSLLWSRSSHLDSLHSRAGSTSGLEPPFGKIVQTDEVRIEYHIREIQKIGQEL